MPDEKYDSRHEILFTVNILVNDRRKIRSIKMKDKYPFSEIFSEIIAQALQKN